MNFQARALEWARQPWPTGPTEDMNLRFYAMGVADGRALYALERGIADEDLMRTSAIYKAVVHMLFGFLASATNGEKVLASPDLVVPIERQHFYYMVRWRESERGWGQRPDGWSLHLSVADANGYIADYWSRQPAVVPSEYSFPSTEPHPVPGQVLTNDEVISVHTCPLGLRRYDNNYPSSRAVEAS